MGPHDPATNPLFRADAPILQGRRGLHRPLDATLGMEGLPSSGTGQTTLLTGRNAVHLHGAHFGPWTPVRLRPLLAAENVMSRVLEAGRRARFLNAVPERYLREAEPRRIPPISLAAQGAGLLVHHEEALRAGRALASGIVNRAWRRLPGVGELPDPSPMEAGRTAARLARDSDLSVFAHFDTDHIGHRGTMAEAVRQVERVEAFLEGLLDEVAPGARVLVVSDHGNLEVAGVGHTRNPALGLWLHPRQAAAIDRREPVRPLRSLMDVTPLILGELGLEEASPAPGTGGDASPDASPEPASG